VLFYLLLMATGSDKDHSRWSSDDDDYEFILSSQEVEVGRHHYGLNMIKHMSKRYIPGLQTFTVQMLALTSLR
jgi:hypothetical protein